MKRNLLSLFVLAATMLIGMTASAQAEKASSLQTASQNDGQPKLQTLLGKIVKANHLQTAPAKPTSQKARKLAGASYDVTAVKWLYDDYYCDVYIVSEEATYIFELKEDLQYGKTYTYADMVSDWVCTLDGEGYPDVTATDATLTVSKDEAGLVHIVATMVLDGDTYNLKYDEKPFAPSGVKVNLNGTDLIGSYMPYYGMYVYQAKVDGNDIQLAFDATAEQATYTADQLIADYCIYTSSDYSVYVEFVKAASDFTVTTTETTKTLSGSVYAANGDEYVLNLVYEKPAPKDISINVQNATLTDRTKAGFWTIDGQTADKNNSFMLYFVGKAFEGTFTDVNSFDSYSTWVSDKSSGTNVYYENLSAVNLASAVVGDSLVIEGTLALADSKGNPANVTLHVSTPYAKESQALVDIKIASLTPAKNIESDGYFTVAAAFNATIDPSLAEDYMELDFYYTVTAEGVEPFSALANTDDLTSGLVNINIPSLQAGKEYTLTIDKVDVINYSKMDWETFEIPSEFTQEGNIASITFTIPMDIKITSLTPAQNIDSDGYFTVAAAFNATIDPSLAEDYMELDFYYTVTAEGMEPFSALANTDDLTGGLVNINIPGLQAGKEYTLTIDKVDVFNYSKMDWETFEIPSEFTQEGNIASVVFTISNATAINKINENKEQVIYNLNGMRLNKATKGINIINGKKFIVR